MEDQSEQVVCKQWEKAERTIAGPLHEHALIVSGHHRLDKGCCFPQHHHGIPGVLQELAVSQP